MRPPQPPTPTPPSAFVIDTLVQDGQMYLAATDVIAYLQIIEGQLEQASAKSAPDTMEHATLEAQLALVREEIGTTLTGLVTPEFRDQPPEG